ncbi:sigma-70 family RNA polymerase sigma factor [Kribbella sp. NPDC051770]|uniref:RNA polymerase sigma factor n=1 Tax=Kribbella sp. NPDC051770 TaxID=3155413 RepID=UPI00343E0D31
MTQNSPPDDDRLQRFERIFSDCYDPLVAYHLRRVANRGDVDDLVAETFLVAWRRLDDVPAGSEALPWLYAVARNTLANHRRREDRRTALTEQLRAVPRSQPSSTSPEATALTAAAWNELPDRDREVLALIAWEGLDVDQVAVALNCSRNAVRIRLHRARRRFERLLRSEPALATPLGAAHEGGSA